LTWIAPGDDATTGAAAADRFPDALADEPAQTHPEWPGITRPESIRTMRC